MDKIGGLTKDSMSKGKDALMKGKDILSKFGSSKSNPRDQSKFQFDIKILKIESLQQGTGSVFVAWKRGTKASNNGQTKPVEVNGKSAAINHSFTLITTLQKEKPPKRTYEEKNISISIKEEKGKKSSTLGKTVLNLSDFTSTTNGRDQFKMISIKQKKGSALQLTLNIATKELEMDPDGEPMTETDMNSNDGSDDEEEGEDFIQDDDTHHSDISSQTSASSSSSLSSKLHAQVVGNNSNSNTPNKPQSTTPTFQRGNSYQAKDDESFSSMTNIPSNLDEQHQKELSQLLGSPVSKTNTTKTTTPTSNYTSPSSSNNNYNNNKIDEQHSKELNALLSNNPKPSNNTTTSNTTTSSAAATSDKKRIQDLEKQISDLQKQKGGGGGGNVLNSTEYLELKQRFKEVASENVDLEDRVKELEDKLNNTRSGVSSTSSSSSSNQKDLKTISDLQDQIKQKNSTIQELNNKVRTLENDMYEQLQTFTLNSSNNSSSSSSNAVAEKDQEIQSLKREIQTLKDQQQQNNISNNTNMSLVGGGTLELKRKIQDLTKEVKDRDDTISKLRSTGGGGGSTPSSNTVSPNIASGQIKVLETENKNQKSEIDRLKQEISSMKLNHQQQQQQPNNSSSATRELQDRILSLQNENRSLLNEIEEINDKLNQSKQNEERLQQNILDLQDSNEQLQNKVQSSMASASSLSFAAVGKNNNSGGGGGKQDYKAEKEKLERSLESLQIELQKERDRTKKLQRELNEQNQRVRDLENELSNNQNGGGSRSSISNGGGGGGGSIAKSDLQEREENRIVEQCIYTQTFTFRDGVGASASSLYSKLTDQNAFSQENSRLFNKVINGITQSIEKAMYNSNELSYWLSNTSGLIHLIKDGPNNIEQQSQDDRDPLIDGIFINQHSSSPTTSNRRSPSLNFYYQLESLSRECYSLLLHNLSKKLNTKLLTLLNQSTSIDKKTNRLSSTMSHTQEINKICKVLAKYLNYFKDNFVFDSIIQQFFSQAFHYISYSLLNEIINNGGSGSGGGGSALCSPTNGFKIKLSISMIEDWISSLEEKDILFPSKEYLSTIIEASNLMVIDKSIFTDSEAILSAFNSLNILQIKKLLEIWKPDQLSPDPIPSSVISMARGNWNRPTNNLQLQIDPSQLIEITPQL